MITTEVPKMAYPSGLVVETVVLTPKKPTTVQRILEILGRFASILKNRFLGDHGDPSPKKKS